MIDILKQQIGLVIAAAGFEVLKQTDEPCSVKLKGKQAAFLSAAAVKLAHTGFDFDSGARKNVYEYTFSCTLYGRQGDCSDRDELVKKAYALQVSLIAAGYGARLVNSDRIDPALSRAECTLEITAALTHTPR